MDGNATFSARPRWSVVINGFVPKLKAQSNMHASYKNTIILQNRTDYGGQPLITNTRNAIRLVKALHSVKFLESEILMITSPEYQSLLFIKVHL